MAFEKLTKSKESRSTASWGPSVSSGTKSPLGLGLLSLNRRPAEWSGRLTSAGIRTRSGGVVVDSAAAGGGAVNHRHTVVHNPAHNPHQAPVESSIDGISAKMDSNRSYTSATESAFERTQNRLTDDDVAELGRMRVALAELARQMDAVLERAVVAAP